MPARQPGENSYWPPTDPDQVEGFDVSTDRFSISGAFLLATLEGGVGALATPDAKRRSPKIILLRSSLWGGRRFLIRTIT